MLRNISGLRRWYVVRLAGREFAIACEPVKEILQLRGQQLMPVPPRGRLRQRLRWQGTWLPVGTPHESFRLAPRPVGPRTCVLISERRLLTGCSIRFGVYVDSLSRVVEFPASDLRREQPRHPYSEGRLKWNGKLHYALDLRALFPEADLLAAVQSPNVA